MLLLDPAIRDWVLLPLLALVVILHFLRSAVMKLTTDAPRVGVDELRLKSVLLRSQRLRAAGGYLSPAGFAARKEYLLAAEGGKLLDAGVADKPANPMSDPSMMKGQVLGMVLGYGPLMWVSSFITGFLLVRVPFPLTARFKSITQQGITLPGLDPSYVSAMSLYFIASMAVGKVLALFARRAGSPEEAEAEMRAQAMAMGVPMMPGMGPGQPPGAGFMAKTAFKAEASALGVHSYTCAMREAEEALLAEGRAVLAQGGGGGAARKQPQPRGRPADASGTTAAAVPARGLSPHRLAESAKDE